MQSYIQIVGQMSPEGPPTVVFHHNNQRYMFNCREGTQRLCFEEKVKLTKLTNVFLTRMQWQCTGGLPGMLLTLADSGIKDIHIHGGKNLTHFMVSLRHFVYRSSTTVDTHEFDQYTPKPFDDGSLRVTPIVILPDRFEDKGKVKVGYKRSHSGSSSGSSSSSEESSSEESSEQQDRRMAKRAIEAMTPEDKRTHRRTMLSRMFGSRTAPPPASEALVNLKPINEGGKPKATVQNLCETTTANYQYTALPRTTPYPAAICYICETAPSRGKFNVESAKALGIPPGKLYGALQQKRSVTLEDGRVIKPEQVMGPDVPGSIFILVDCPDTTYIDRLVSSSGWEPYYKKQQTTAIFHMVSDSVLADARYRMWMNKFDKEAEHVVGTENISAQTIQFKSHALAQYKLSKLDPRIFPIPSYSNTPTSKLEQYEALPNKCIPMASMDSYSLNPLAGLNFERDAAMFDHTQDTAEGIRDFHTNTDMQSAIQNACAEAAKVDMSDAFPGSELEVITLGTGSSIPAKYRNVSATMVRVPTFGSILLDAGEGTYGQMMRLFGPKRLDQELSAIRCIFVSHMHADHHLGVIQLLNKWYTINKGLDKTLYVVAPSVFQRWIRECNDVERIGRPRQVRYIRNEAVAYRPKALGKPRASEQVDIRNLQDALGLESITAVEVIHCPNAYGLSLQHRSGWKLVYSGDTRPCEELVAAGQGATLLIHEATLDDTKLAEAMKKRHSTTGEAVLVGQRMNARYTLLNHFSQRYPKIPSLSQDQENVCFSFDFMTVTVKEIPKLPKFTPALQLLFECETDV